MNGRAAPTLLCMALVAVIPALTACAQTVSPERAYERCAERARLAAQPRGSIGLGAGSGGASANFELTVTNDFLQGRDPQLVYENCFRDLTGSGPTRPLIL